MECQVQMIAPDMGKPGEWKQMFLKKPVRDPEDEEEEDDDEPFYETSSQLSRGKYRVAFRVLRRSKEPEYFEAVTLIVSDSGDYNL